MSTVTPEPKNYIDQVALKVWDMVEQTMTPNKEDMLLFRAYALLVLTKWGVTTPEDVHNAWAVWAATYSPRHPSLKPFAELTPEVQALDEPYARAIRFVAADLAVKRGSTDG